MTVEDQTNGAEPEPRTARCVEELLPIAASSGVIAALSAVRSRRFIGTIQAGLFVDLFLLLHLIAVVVVRLDLVVTHRRARRRRLCGRISVGAAGTRRIATSGYAARATHTARHGRVGRGRAASVASRIRLGLRDRSAGYHNKRSQRNDGNRSEISLHS